MSAAWAQHYHYMAEHHRFTALAYEAEAKAVACNPGSNASSREWDEANSLNLAHDQRQRATEWDEMAAAEMRERAA